MTESSQSNSTPSAPCVRLQALTRRYGDFLAVDRVDLQVGRGEFFGLLGPNGAGKSTIIKMITGMLAPTSGRIEVLGRDVSQNVIEIKQRIGLLPEDSNLYERLTGAEYVRFVGRMYDLEESEVRSRTGELLEILDLVNGQDDMIIDYSLGMKKKVGLAAALIHNPEILFLDEPFNGVDVGSSRTVKDILQKLVDRGVTVFFSSHVMEMVEKLCTRVAILKQGRIVATGTVEELRRDLGSGEEVGLEEMFLRSIGEHGPLKSLSWIGESSTTDRGVENPS